MPTLDFHITAAQEKALIKRICEGSKKKIQKLPKLPDDAGDRLAREGFVEMDIPGHDKARVFLHDVTVTDVRLSEAELPRTDESVVETKKTRFWFGKADGTKEKGTVQPAKADVEKERATPDGNDALWEYVAARAFDDAVDADAGRRRAHHRRLLCVIDILETDMTAFRPTDDLVVGDIVRWSESLADDKGKIVGTRTNIALVVEHFWHTDQDTLGVVMSLMQSTGASVHDTGGGNAYLRARQILSGNCERQPWSDEKMRERRKDAQMNELSEQVKRRGQDAYKARSSRRRTRQEQAPNL